MLRAASHLARSGPLALPQQWPASDSDWLAPTAARPATGNHETDGNVRRCFRNLAEFRITKNVAACLLL
eukprot:12603449-Alexandrium_andersonii.AAC.2